MKELRFIDNFFLELKNTINLFNIYYKELIRVKKLFKTCSNNKGKVILVGNGGSAAIASHVSVDLAKNAEIRAVNFNEADLITCLSNDYSYDDWIRSALKLYCDKKDIIVFISTSGNSKNHINGIKYAKKNRIKAITFTGFKKNNFLKSLNKNGINFWINSNSYNIVELAHLSLLLCIVDLCIGKMIYSSRKKLF
jgi:D-sedoheptulose 7-phosphate isomerase